MNQRKPIPVRSLSHPSSNDIFFSLGLNVLTKLMVGIAGAFILKDTLERVLKLQIEDSHLYELGYLVIAFCLISEMISSHMNNYLKKKKRYKDCNYAISVLRENGFNVGFLKDTKSFEKLNDPTNKPLRAYGCLRYHGVPFVLLNENNSPIGTVRVCKQNGELSTPFELVLKDTNSQ